MNEQTSFIDKILSFWLRVGSRSRWVKLTDAFMLSLAVYLGYSLRLTFFIKEGYRGEMLMSIAFLVPTMYLVLHAGKIYKIVWPQASVEEYARLFKYYCLGAALFMLEHFFVKGYVGPRSSISIMLLLGIIFLGGARASWRLLQIARFERRGARARAIIVGAGEAGAQLARDLLRRESGAVPVGFIDDSEEKEGMIIASLRVMGKRENIADIIKSEKIDVVLIAIPSATGKEVSAYLDILAPTRVPVRVLPSLSELAGGAVEVSRLRSVSLEDLLRREPVKLDDEGISSVIRGRRILVTGAGGSIGSEICRQILRHSPNLLLALGHGEQSIYELLEKIEGYGEKIRIVPIIADIADRQTMEKVFREHRPEVVFHAGAHKHVPLMEFNPREALRVNALGTRILAELACENGAERFVMVSTDKAVNPSSVMGATKRTAERLLTAVQEKYRKTACMTVRFGNVLGSRGSVVPKFEKQIERGGPVTLTHVDMKRYFMLIPEAVSLVLQAAAIGRGGDVFVLDMGEPVKISDLAETLIRLHGYEPNVDIPIVYTGIRPGEKLFEELFFNPDTVTRTAHDKIFLNYPAPEERDLLPDVENILSASASGEITAEELRERIMEMGR